MTFIIGVILTPAFIMGDTFGDNEDNEDKDFKIVKATQGYLKYKDCEIDFIEKDGYYAYSDFFIEGNWPDKYYEDTELLSKYNGLRLKLVNGGWCNSLVNLIQSIYHIPNQIINEEDEIEILSIFNHIKNKNYSFINIIGNDFLGYNL